MRNKTIFILLIVVIFSLLSGCSSKFSDIPKEDRPVYEEVYQLYEYAEKMIDKDIVFAEMYKDDKFRSLVEKHVDNDSYPNEELKIIKIELLGIITIYDEDLDKEFAKQQFEELKQNYSIFK